MFSSEEYEAALRDVVTAKRLSASKMGGLTDMTMKNVEYDTQIVSILYRTHKSLPSANAKISSLYVFDALSRAARSHSSKHGLSGDAFTQPGNSASFLFKVGGVVEGLFQDMIAIGSAEAKEKTKKILDIWERGSTFPADVISQLKLIVKDVEQVHEAKMDVVADPRLSSIPPPTPAQSPPNPTFGAIDPQAALLALLTQAAASMPTMPAQTVPLIATNVGSPPQLDATQLAVIQQLAHTAASVPPVSQSLPFAESVNVQKFPSSSGFNDSSQTIPSFRNEPRTSGQNEQRYNGYRSPESKSHPDSHFDDRDNMRGRYRSAFRNSGRVDRFQGRNWDDRDRDYRDPEKDRSPVRKGRGGRSRSRSPSSRYGGRKDSRYFSPPRRNSAPTQQSGQQKVSREPEPGKDEFGRDIRPESPVDSPITNHKNAQSPSHTSLLPDSPKQVSKISAVSVASNVEQGPDTEQMVINTSSISSESSAAKALPGTSGMETFDPSNFDYTSPSSWEALGKMWQVTHGHLPSTAELMQFVTSGLAFQSNSATTTTNHISETNHSNFNRGRGRGRGGFSFTARGRGGSFRGNGRSLYGGGDWTENAQATDAIVLGGGGDDADAELDQYAVKTIGSPTATYEAQYAASSNSTSGRMQRIGDKWVFVRDGASVDVS